MNDLATDLYVALRTAPKILRKRYGSPKLAMEGDQATREMVDLIIKAMQNYTIEYTPKPPERMHTSPPSGG